MRVIRKLYYCDWIGPATIDTAAMNDTMERGIIAKADAIITQGVIDEQLVKQAKENNIPVVLVDNDMPASARTAFFGKNFTQQAELLLADIEKRMGEDEPIIMAIQVAEESFPIAAQQIEEIEKVFLKHRGGFEIVDVTSSKSDKVRARKEWVSTFEKYENVNVSISLASESVESVTENAKELHKSDNMLIYGVDDLQPTIQLLKKGRITGSIITPFYDYGYKTVKYLKSYWENEDNSKKERFDVDIQMLTKEEAKDIHMKSSVKKTLKEQLAHFHSIVFVVTLVGFTFYIGLNFSSMNKYSDAFHQYDQIQQFYTSLEQANEHFIDYLYRSSKDAYYAYEKEIARAKESLLTLQNANLMEEGWRIHLLENMLDTYVTQAEETYSIYQENNIEYENAYNNLLNIYDVIKSTSADSYSLLTNNMELQNEKLRKSKQYSIYTLFLFTIIFLSFLFYYIRLTRREIEQPLNKMKKILTK